MEVLYMNGAGNDFMVLDARGKTMDFSRMALELCRLSGADGFMAVDTSETADFKLHFYNSDGTRGEMCGNGARCICRYAFEKGIAGAHMTVETDAGPVEGWRIDENTYRVKLNNPSILDLHRKGEIAYVELGNPGIPHAVAEYSGDLWKDREALKDGMRALRHDPAFPKGANVNFYQRLGKNEVRMLTFERGVEDFTLACGTGTGSTACVLWKLEGLTRLTARNPGGTLAVEVQGCDGHIDSIFLEGPTEIVKAYNI